MQCKVPLFANKPNIYICVEEKDHEGLHYTYGLDGIWFSTAQRDRAKEQQ